jgi:hypothetical protein
MAVQFCNIGIAIVGVVFVRIVHCSKKILHGNANACQGMVFQDENVNDGGTHFRDYFVETCSHSSGYLGFGVVTALR